MPDSIGKTCAFTGHREMEENFDTARFKDVLSEMIKEGYTTFLCGMAVGFDLFAAQVVLELKESFKQIKLIACVPCKGQEKYFSAEDKQKYCKILKRCDEVKTLSDRYYRGCMLARDRYMVDNSSLLIAYRRVNAGGTYYTLKYALTQNKRIWLV